MTVVNSAGMVSGMDIQSFVDKLVKAESAKITKVEDKQIAVQADISAWTALSGTMTSLTSSLYTLRSYDTWNKMAATSSDVTKVTATASSGALSKSYSIDVTRLAQAQSVASGKASDLGLTGVNDLLTNVTGINVFDQFTIEGETVTIEADDTLSTLRDKLNGASADLVDQTKAFTASILDNRLVITRDNTGSETMAFAEVWPGGVLDKLNIYNGSYENQLAAAHTALFTVNGASVERSSNTDLTDVIENVSLNLLNETPLGPITLNINRNTDTPKAALLDFITNYNATVAKIQEYTSIDLSNPKKPVTGELQNDQQIAPMLSSLRRLATANQSQYMDSTNAAYTYGGNAGVMNSLEDIGIWTSGKENSLSVVDEDKLDAMLTNNFDKVEQMVRGVAGDDGLSHGVIDEFYTYADAQTSKLTGMIDKRVVSLQDKVTAYTTQTEKMWKDLEAYEQKLWRQFGAMEDAMASLQSQLASLTGMLGMNK